MGWLRTAVILGAGTGSRLGSISAERPKGFVEFGDRPIIGESIGKLVRCGITEIIIVSGYKKEFYETLAKEYPFVRITVNPEFETTGSMASLSYAVPLVQNDFLLVEADLVYEIRGLLALQNSSRKDCILVSGPTESGDEVYVGTDGDRVRIISKSKSLVNRPMGELVGLSRISFATFQVMVSESASRRSVRTYDYENCLTDIAERVDIGVEYIGDLAWIEIDTPAQFRKARAQVYPLVVKRDAQVRFHKNLDRPLLFNPGPATTTDSVKLAQFVEDICPRETDFGVMVESMRRDLVRIVHGEGTHEAVLFSSSGTGAVEACLSSVVPPGLKVLIINNGAYGKRMQEICDSFQIPHIDYDIPWGDPIDLHSLKALLERHHFEISHLAFVHHETTVGILNPLEPIALLARGYGIELIVDAISSFAGIPIDLRRTKVDYLITSSGKCLQGMAGVGIVLCNKVSLAQTRDIPPRNFYFNLFRNYEFHAKHGQMQFTPPVQTFYALRQAINEYFLEGEEGRWRRYAEMYSVLRDGLRTLGFRFLVDEKHHSRILTAVLDPEDPRYDFDTMHDALRERGFTIYPGKGATKNAFRIATMGAMDPKDVRRLLECLKEFLDQSGISLSPEQTDRNHERAMRPYAWDQKEGG